jgi:hypothetical protein
LEIKWPGEQLILKLWETLAEKGIGSLLKPWQVVREGRAIAEVRRHDLLSLAQAEADAAEVRAGRKLFRPDGSIIALSFAPETDLPLLKGDGRIEPTLEIQSLANAAATRHALDAARAEINVNRAIIFAEERLAQDSHSPPDREIDDDWLFAWREYAGKISSEDLQRLWGNALAGEVKSPGSYSIRTLDFLRTLSKQEAQEISDVSSFVMQGSIIRSQSDYLQDRGITFSRLLRLQDLGIITGVGSYLTTTFTSLVEGRFLYSFRNYGKLLLVRDASADAKLTLEIYLLSALGREIMTLGEFSADIEYLKRVGRDIAAKGFDVELADIVKESNGSVEYVNGVKIQA